jgi:LmbE family N-acetylglucosaminyl deacetylase
MKKKVLVIAVHPDDETLGCGGTLLKHKANGDEIHWLIVTSLDKSHSYYNQREKEIQEVALSYNFNSVHELGFQTMEIDKYSIGELVEKISNVINMIQPTTLYLPFKGDVHSDHRKIFEAAYSCTKSFRYPFIKQIYMMETLSETEFAPSTKEDSFIPNIFIDISQYFDIKTTIMQFYKSELQEHPFPRSTANLNALATLRGATAGCIYAESFMLLKEIK